MNKISCTVSFLERNENCFRILILDVESVMYASAFLSVDSFFFITSD